MADQKNITLYEFDATPKNIILNSLPVADLLSGSVIYLYPLSTASPTGQSPKNMVLREFDSTPQNIILESLLNWDSVPLNNIITIRRLLVSEEELPPPLYYAILKMWSGATWIKAPLKVWLGVSWESKPFKFWDGSQWRLIDTTGLS